MFSPSIALCASSSIPLDTFLIPISIFEVVRSIIVGIFHSCCFLQIALYQSVGAFLFILHSHHFGKHIAAFPRSKHHILSMVATMVIHFWRRPEMSIMASPVGQACLWDGELGTPCVAHLSLSSGHMVHRLYNIPC